MARLRQWQLAALAAAPLLAAGCGPQKYHVALYSGDKVVREWTAVGDTHGTDAQAWFRDAKTGGQVTISGTFAVEPICEEVGR